MQQRHVSILFLIAALVCVVFPTPVKASAFQQVFTEAVASVPLSFNQLAAIGEGVFNKIRNGIKLTLCVVLSTDCPKETVAEFEEEQAIVIYEPVVSVEPEFAPESISGE